MRPSRSGKSWTAARSDDTATPTTSTEPISRRSTAWRSDSRSIALSRLRYRAASSKRSAAAASFICSSSRRRIGLSSPERNSITWSISSR